MKTIEQMAEEAGFDANHPNLHWPGIYANEDGRDDITEQLQRFAALVAERCAEIVQLRRENENTSDGHPDEHLAAVQATIRAEFPKP